MTEADRDRNVTIRIPADLHKAIVEAAHRDRRSLNAEILVALETWLARREGS